LHNVISVCYGCICREAPHLAPRSCSARVPGLDPRSVPRGPSRAEVPAGREKWPPRVTLQTLSRDFFVFALKTSPLLAALGWRCNGMGHRAGSKVPNLGSKSGRGGRDGTPGLLSAVKSARVDGPRNRRGAGPRAMTVDGVGASGRYASSHLRRNQPSIGLAYRGSRALIAGSNSIIGCAASHMRSMCASNFRARRGRNLRWDAGARGTLRDCPGKKAYGRNSRASGLDVRQRKSHIVNGDCFGAFRWTGAGVTHLTLVAARGPR
jgi:hypothetical protein